MTQCCETSKHSDFYRLTHLWSLRVFPKGTWIYKPTGILLSLFQSEDNMCNCFCKSLRPVLLHSQRGCRGIKDTGSTNPSTGGSIWLGKVETGALKAIHRTVWAPCGDCDTQQVWLNIFLGCTSAPEHLNVTSLIIHTYYMSLVWVWVPYTSALCNLFLKPIEVLTIFQLCVLHLCAPLFK